MSPSYRKNFSIWWGPPKEFSKPEQHRRVSWLELFYDVVYVIAIARITHHFAAHISLAGFVEYTCLFMLIYWGWLNGSLHHDLHGNQGLRTRLMTLWQMMIVAALAILIDKMHGHYRDVTIVFMIFQVFLTYQWWSVGLYDKSHRPYSRPYIAAYLISFSLMAVSLFVADGWKIILVPVILILNFIPPFITARLLRRDGVPLDLSHSMFERMGLFTIIVFGEVIIGVVTGMGQIESLGTWDWIHFVLAVTIVFELWWLFFTFISRRRVKKGFAKGSLLELLYFPCLVALGCIAASFSGLFTSIHFSFSLISFAIAAFILGIYSMMHLLEYHAVFDTIFRSTKNTMLITAFVFIVLGILNPAMHITAFLSMVVILLLVTIALLNYLYYNQLIKEGLDPSEL